MDSDHVPATFGIPDEVRRPQNQSPTLLPTDLIPRVLALRPKRFKANSSILRLSPEIVKSIFYYIRRPADQVKFALCCKTLARVANTTQLNTLIILSPEKSKIRAYNTEDLKQKLRGWHSLRKYRACKGMLPRRRVWTIKDGTKITKLKRVDWVWAVKDWMGGGTMCPPCRISEYYDGSAGWLQFRPEGLARTTMFHHLEKAR